MRLRQISESTIELSNSSDALEMPDHQELDTPKAPNHEAEQKAANHEDELQQQQNADKNIIQPKLQALDKNLSQLGQNISQGRMQARNTGSLYNSINTNVTQTRSLVNNIENSLR